MYISKKIFITLFSLFLILSPVFSADSATPTKEDLTEKIGDVNDEIAKLDKEIAKYENEIAKTGAEAKTLSNHIKTLNLTRSKLLKQVEQINSQIKSANRNIEDISEKILTKEEQINLAQKTISKTFYDVYQSDNTDPIEIMIRDGGLKALSSEFNNKILLNEKLDSFIETLNDIKLSLNKSKEEKEAEKKKLNELNEKLSLEKKAVDQSKSEKDSLLKETKNQEASYQKLLLENKKKLEAFEKDLREYETQLKFILNNNLLPEKGNGVLSWPLKKFLITQLFGKTADSGRLYASGSHSGVDFGIPVGTPIYAIADGKIEGVGDTDAQCKGVSFGKWVFIRHNNGLASAYGHMSATSAIKGKEVKRGDLIGLSGNTGHSTGPHLHLAVYAGQGAEVKNVPTKSAYCKGVSLTMPVAPINAYLDPMVYLPQATPAMYKKGVK